ncbi:hypothetical protein ACFOG5_02695 [Pedobacter fastidiosus]
MVNEIRADNPAVMKRRTIIQNVAFKYLAGMTILGIIQYSKV